MPGSPMPPLREIENAFKRIRKVLDLVEEPVKWYYGEGFATRVGERYGEGIRRGNWTSSTESAAVSDGAARQVREENRRIAGNVMAAAANLEGVMSAIARIEKALDHEPDTDEGPPFKALSAVELKQAKARKERRDRERPTGVGYGEY